MKRQLVFDTETTGLHPDNGDRIIEICAVELIDGVKTGDYFLTLINPERSIPDEVVKIHHIDDAKVKDAPIFKDIADKFLEYIKGAELIIHNADFDIKMVNAELNRINKGKIWDYVSNSIDTLKLSRRLYENEKKHNLDAMCTRFGLDLSEREKSGHGAFIDCQLLAECYLKIIAEHPVSDLEAEIGQKNWTRPEVKRYDGLVLTEVKLTEKEEKLHELFLERIAEKDKVTPVFLKLGSSPKPAM